MKRIIFITIGLIWSVSVFAQLEHNQETNDAEGGLIIRNSNNQSVRLWVDSNDTRHIGRGNNSRIAIKTDGLVGIGLQDPTYGILHLKQSSNNGDGGLAIQHPTSSFSMRFWVDDNAVRHIGTGTTSRFSINSDGNIGFGTSNIQTRLTIDSDATKFITLKRPGNTKYAHIGYGTANNGGIYLGTDDSQYSLWVQQNGDVGIGTFNPDAKLAVNGTIHTKEVKVDLNGWSDFVFENNYELRTLEEVERQINKNGHLPEIPSEAEVTKNGINLGEMDAKLLQKIEELTLYMIDLNKQVQQLKAENKELKSKIED